MARISLIPTENYSIFDCEDDCEHEILVRSFLDGLMPRFRSLLLGLVVLTDLDDSVQHVCH